MAGTCIWPGTLGQKLNNIQVILLRIIARIRALPAASVQHTGSIVLLALEFDAQQALDSLLGKGSCCFYNGNQRLSCRSCPKVVIRDVEQKPATRV